MFEIKSAYCYFVKTKERLDVVFYNKKEDIIFSITGSSEDDLEQIKKNINDEYYREASVKNLVPKSITETIGDMIKHKEGLLNLRDKNGIWKI